MSDKIRGAIFNILGDIAGLTVLDAYAGSGALSIEAISRGASTALAVEIDKDAVRAIRANISRLQLTDSVQVKLQNISSWSQANAGKTFDLVFADPPYDDIRPDLLGRLAGHVKPGGVMVLSWPGKEAIRQLPLLELAAHKRYGDAQLVAYRRA